MTMKKRKFQYFKYEFFVSFFVISPLIFVNSWCYLQNIWQQFFPTMIWANMEKSGKPVFPISILWSAIYVREHL